MVSKTYRITSLLGDPKYSTVEDFLHYCNKKKISEIELVHMIHQPDSCVMDASDWISIIAEINNETIYQDITDYRCALSEPDDLIKSEIPKIQKLIDDNHYSINIINDLKEEPKTWSRMGKNIRKY